MSEMNELTELRFNDSRIFLENNIVKSAILPRIAGELERDVVVKGNCRIDGAIYARNFEVQQGPLRVRGAVFTQLELHVNGDAQGEIIFEKSVAVGADPALQGWLGQFRFQLHESWAGGKQNRGTPRGTRRKA